MRTRPVRVNGVQDAVQLAAGRYFTCALRARGHISCWGDRGQLGRGTGRPKVGLPRRGRGPGYVDGIQDAVQLTAGLFHACALRSSGHVSCWGSNRNQQLGDGSQPDAGSPDDDRMAFSPVDVHGLSDAVEVAAGNAHTCAVRRGGDVVCWGFNGFGQLGDGTQSERNTPVAVQHLRDVVALSAGGFHNCALTRLGKVLCWGRNDAGQLGNGTDRDSALPMELPSLCSEATCSETSAPPPTSRADTIAAVPSRSPSSAPSRASEPQEPSAPSRASEPQEPSAPSRASEPQEASASSRTSEPQEASASPSGSARVLSPVAQITAAERHTCARHLSGAVQCWGSGEGGRLGHGTEEDRAVPTLVAGIDDAVQVSAGGMHTCALRSSGDAMCWGVNDGQIGDGTTRVRPVPTPVSGLPTAEAKDVAIGIPD